MQEAAQASQQGTDQYHAWWGYAVDALWLSAPVAAQLLEIEKIIGGFVAAIVALLALGTAVYRFIYWRAKAKLEMRALEKTGWNRNQAALLLRLNRTTLVEKIKKKGLRPPELS